MICYGIGIVLVLILAFIIANTFRCGLKSYSGGTKHGIKYEHEYKHDTKDENTIQKYSYSIYNGDIGLVYDELKQLLAQYNFHEEPLTKHVHLSIGSASGVDIYGKRNFEVRIINGKKQYLDPLFVNQKSVIKSILGGIKSLHYKNKLYETIKNLIPGGMKYMPKTYTIQEFDTKLNNIHANSLKILFKTSDTEYKWPDTFLNDDNYKDMQHSLDAYIEEIIQSDSVPYNESNSGFTIIVPTIDFIASEENLSKFKPQIRYIYILILESMDLIINNIKMHLVNIIMIF